MKETTTRLTSSTYLGLQSFKSAWQRLSMMLLTVIMAFAGAQTAGAQKTCFVTFDISGEGTVEFGGGSVTNYGSAIQVDRDLTSNAMFEMALLPDEGYYVSSATYQLFKYYYDNSFTLITSGDLSNDEGNNWSFVINEYPYDNSNSFPLIVVHIVFTKQCFVTFDISGEGTVELQGEEQWLEVTNGQTIDCSIPYDRDLTITPETGYVVSSVTYDATDGLSIDLNQDDDFQWSLHIDSYEGSETPTITVHIVFGLAGGADEASAVALTADDDFHLAGGWYKVESDLALGHTVNLHGDTHIIIASGKTLTVNTSDEYGISGSALTVSGEGTLAVSANRAIYVDNYTQMGCAVTLSGDTDGLTAENNVSISGGSLTTSGAIIGIDTNNGSITISGGTVSSSGDSAGLFAGDDVSITGGTVSASGDNNGIRGYSVSITGGQVNVSSGGIYSTYGDITLGWTSATDYITASGYVLQNDGYHVKIADGQTLYGGGFPSASLTGTIDDPSALNGLMLRPTAAVTESGTNEYTIWNAAGWDLFCDRLAANGGKDFFSGKTVKLADDITVSRMAGASQHDFMGKFDGQGYTLTFNYNTGTDDAAPFRYVEDGCVIENLRVCGTIETSAKYAAGLVAHQYGNVTIRNCRSSVTIKSSVSSENGDGTHGGFVAENCKDGDITFEGCLFDGKLLKTGGTGTNRCGGFVGWRSNNTEAVIKVKNSLYAPAALEVGEYWISTTESATFVRDGIASDITNSYYTSDFNDGSSFTGQGKQRRSIAAGEGVTIGHDGAATEYSVSGITAYKASGACGDSDPFTEGILYDEVLYAGSGDEVSLTLANSSGDAPLGYKNGDYSASGGATLSGTTLTMADEDVTVSFTPGALRSTGQAVPVSYIDADGILCDGQDGRPDPANAIALDGTEGSLNAGWYFVGADISHSGQISCYDNVNIILTDGKTMTVSGSSYGIYSNSSNRTLTIYGQTLGNGTLNATGRNNGIYHYMGNVVICGGTVNATGTNYTGIYAKGSVTITGGQVTASSNYCGIEAGGNVTITGGKVSATGTATGEEVGIYSEEGNITLGWTSASDFIKASSYYLVNSNRTVSIASGQSLYNGSEVLGSGTVDDYASKLDGKTLVPYIESTTADGTAILYDNDAGLPDGHRNADRIATLAADGSAHDIMLLGRTLYKDGDWNTLCLPFSVGDRDTADGLTFSCTPLAGAEARPLSAASITGTTLNLNFGNPVSTLVAGTPYIIKWGNTEGTEPTEATEHIVNPVFSGVTVSSTAAGSYDTQSASPAVTTDERVRFIGTYDQKTIDTEDKSILFLGAGNKLYYPDGTGSGVTIGAFRAYFKIGDGDALARQLTAFNIDFGDETGIGHTEITEITEKAGAWYTLDGVRLDGKPTKRSAEGRLLPTGRKKGLYIHGGKKVVVP